MRNLDGRRSGERLRRAGVYLCDEHRFVQVDPLRVMKCDIWSKAEGAGLGAAKEAAETRQIRLRGARRLNRECMSS